MLKVTQPIKLLCFLLLYSMYYCFGQALPPVAHFQTKDYQADNQNWAITQTRDNTLFFANGQGLLKYDGEHWELLGSPNNTVLRSVYAVGDLVYTGAYMEFGVWERSKTGKFVYTSLSKNTKLIEDEQFWTISSLEGNVIFQSLDAIYMYDIQNDEISIIRAKGEITKMVILNNELYYHIKNEGLFKLVNGQEVLLNDSNIVKNSTLINVYTINEQLFVQTQFNGIINIESNKTFKPLNADARMWSNLSVYSSYQKPNGDIYVGTISGGLLKISNNKVVYNLNQNNTLSNNTVLSVFNDQSNNIWLGLDNGINSIDDDSDISIFNDKEGQIGTIYSTINHNGILYVGSNQGLFYFDELKKKFILVKGTSGQVWSLFSFNNTLFCGHHNGTFLIDGKKSEYIENTRGTWGFRVKDEKTILSGNYDGLYVYSYDTSWTLKNKISGFNISTQHFEFIDSNSVLVNHEYKGLIKLNLDNSMTTVLDNQIIKSVDKGLFSSIIKYNGMIYYAYKEGIFKYDTNKSTFIKDSILSKIVRPDNFSSGIMKKTENDKLWLFNSSDIISVSTSSLKNQYLIDKIPINNELRHQISGYENISYDPKGKYRIGRSNGFIEIISECNFDKNPRVFLTQFIVKDKDNNELEGFEPSEISSDFNNITIQVSSFNYDPLLKSEYQYKLNGYNENWSNWQTDTQFNFKNLPFGDYSLLVRSRVGEDNISEIQKINFTIQKPFYLSTPMMLLYGLLILVIAFSTHLIYNSYYKKQKMTIQKEAERKLRLKELEKQKEIMDVNNKQLKQDIEHKNRELAISTMSLIKKNEFLSNIKTDLKPLKTTENIVKKVIKAIDMNIDSQDDWKFFEEAFNNADKDFFKKLKENHALLTHNDFKLCA